MDKLNFEIVKYNEAYNHDIFNLYCDFRNEEDLYYEYNYEGFENHLFKNRGFQIDGSFVALVDNKVVGFAGSEVRDANTEKTAGYIHTFIVKKEYRRNGIGSKMLEKCEEYIKANGGKYSRLVFLSSINWPWYIPHTEHHRHPGMPCVQMNSEFYIFLYHHGYFVNSIHEGFHLPLSQYEMPAKVVKLMEENAKDGLKVEIYDPNKHVGIQEFCEEIIKDGNNGFANSIRYNLQREQPRPFLVATRDNKVCGWTGAMYVEEDGRGHLDGIIVSPRERKHGLGKALFCNLCYNLKNMGSTYMTFFTGLDNPARYIYMGAGFQVAQSFADMKKNLE